MAFRCSQRFFILIWSDLRNLVTRNNHLVENIKIGSVALAGQRRKNGVTQ